MKCWMKKVTAIILVTCLSAIGFYCMPVSAAFDEGIMPCYNNTESATISMSINDSGTMTISYRVTGYPSKTTKIMINSYIEKRTLGIFWSRVDNGETNEEWVDIINDYRYTGSRTFKLSSTGTYRVKTTYKIYGTGGSVDEISCEVKDTY